MIGLTYAQAEAVRNTARAAFRAAAERARDPWLRGYAIRDMRDALIAFDFARRSYVLGGNWHQHKPGELGPMPAGALVSRDVFATGRRIVYEFDLGHGWVAKAVAWERVRKAAARLEIDVDGWRYRVPYHGLRAEHRWIDTSGRVWRASHWRWVVARLELVECPIAAGPWSTPPGWCGEYVRGTWIDRGDGTERVGLEIPSIVRR